MAQDGTDDQVSHDSQRLARKLRLRDGLGFLARVVSAQANQLFEDLTRQKTITARQYGALLTLHQHGPLTLTDLAVHISVDRSTLTDMVQRMVRDGLIRKSYNDNDRRSSIVVLTADGAAAVARLTPGAAKVQDVLMAPLAPAERRQMLRWMKLIIDANEDLY